MEVGQKVKIRSLKTFEVLYGVITDIEEEMFEVSTDNKYWKVMTFDKTHMRGIRRFTGWVIEGILKS